MTGTANTRTDALLAARRAGDSTEELSDRAWALSTSDLPPALTVLLGLS